MCTKTKKLFIKSPVNVTPNIWMRKRVPDGYSNVVLFLSGWDGIGYLQSMRDKEHLSVLDI